MRIAGVDIGGTSIKLGVFEEDALIFKANVKTPFGSPEGVCDAIAQLLDQQQASLVGVGTAGSVEFRHDTVSASNLGWEGVPLRQMLTDRLGLPVWVDNDAQVAAVAEWQDGALAGCSCGIYLTLGTGIGGALIVDGKPYRGPNHLGAELGHMIIDPHGMKCSCGRRGCLEAYASATALKRMAGGQSAYAVMNLAKSGNPRGVSLFNRYVHRLCIGLSNLVMIFDPQVIALGGGLSGAGDFLADACQKELARMFARTTDPLYTEIRIAKHQNDAGIRGAALLAKQTL